MNLNIRRAFVAVTIAALAAIPLAACGTDGTPAVADFAATSNVVTPSPDPTDIDAIFLQVVAEHGLHGQSAIDAAKATCEALNAGVTPEQVALIALDSFDGDIDKAGALLGAGVEAYCPEYSDALANIGSGASS